MVFVIFLSLFFPFLFANSQSPMRAGLTWGRVSLAYGSEQPHQSSPRLRWTLAKAPLARSSQLTITQAKVASSGFSYARIDLTSAHPCPCSCEANPHQPSFVATRPTTSKKKKGKKKKRFKKIIKNFQKLLILALTSWPCYEKWRMVIFSQNWSDKSYW